MHVIYFKEAPIKNSGVNLRVIDNTEDLFRIFERTIFVLFGHPLRLLRFRELLPIACC